MRSAALKSVIFTIALLGMSTFAAAQEHSGLRHSRGRTVAVIDSDRREWQGTLLEVSADAILLEVQSTPTRFDLASITRVDSRGDRINDGAIKGAVVGAVFGSLSFGWRGLVGGAMTYSLIGLGLDALNDCNHTVYRAPQVPAGDGNATKVNFRISW